MTESPYDFIDVNRNENEEPTEQEALYKHFREVFGIEADDPYRTRTTKDEVSEVARQLGIVPEGWIKGRIIFELVNRFHYERESYYSWEEAKTSARDYNYLQKREIQSLIKAKKEAIIAEADGVDEEEPEEGSEDETDDVFTADEPSQKYPEPEGEGMLARIKRVFGL